MRPANILADLAKTFPCQIEIVHHGERINAKSFLDVVTLVAVQGTELSFEALGQNAQQALDEIAKLFESRFGEAEEDVVEE